MSKITATMEVKKIFCAYHPSEFLTNFCCDKECLMPLCPNCVVEHTQQHFLENNKPTYLNLNEALTDIKQKCYHHIVIYEELKASNDSLHDCVVGLKDAIHLQLEDSKHLIFSSISHLFELYEEKIYRSTLQKYDSLSAYDKKEIQCISQYVTEQIDSLYEKISTLKSEKCLAGLITYFAEDEASFQEGIQEITSYIQQNKNAGKMHITLNSDKHNTLFHQFCENLLDAQFRTEEEQCKNQQNSQKSHHNFQSFRNRFGKKRQTRKNEERNGKENQSNVNEEKYKVLIKKSEEFYKNEVEQSGRIGKRGEIRSKRNYEEKRVGEKYHW